MKATWATTRKGPNVASNGRWDELKLWQLGYKQELRRKLTLFNSCGAALVIMSCFVIADLFALQGLTFGGPVVMIWGWIGVAISTMCIGACLAELCSAFPTTGGLYYVSYVLAPPKLRRISCWLTGWLNTLGQVTFIATTELATAKFFITLASLHKSGPGEGPGWEPTSNQMIGVFAALLASHAAMCSIGIEASALLLTLGALWHVIAAPAFLITLLVVAPEKQPSSWVLTEWSPNTEFHGIVSPTYIAMVGLLMSQWNLCGYDCCMHLCEETQRGDWAASYAMIIGIGASALLGLFNLLTLLHCVQSVEAVTDPTTIARGGLAQLTWDVFKARSGTGWPAVPVLYIPAIALWFCSYNCVLAGGRMAFAFSRDDAMLGSRWWRKTFNGTPIPATVLMVVLAFLVGLPGILYTQAFNAISSTCVAAMNLSYIIPVLLRLGHGRRGFIPGPFSLGVWYLPLAIIGTLWVVFSTVAFSLPSMYPITWENFNYAPVMLVALILFSLVLWVAPLGGSSWFQGPSPNLHTSKAVVDLPVVPSTWGTNRQNSQELQDDTVHSGTTEGKCAVSHDEPHSIKSRQASEAQLTQRHSVMLGELMSLAEEGLNLGRLDQAPDGQQQARLRGNALIAPVRPSPSLQTRSMAAALSAALADVTYTYNNPLAEEDRMSSRRFRGEW